MKNIIILTLFLFGNSLGYSFTTQRIISIKDSDRYRLYKLKNTNKIEVELDCSSFFHNLTIYNLNSNDYIYYLSVDECEKFYEFYKKINLKKKCLSYDQETIFYHYCIN